MIKKHKNNKEVQDIITKTWKWRSLDCSSVDQLLHAIRARNDFVLLYNPINTGNAGSDGNAANTRGILAMMLTVYVQCKMYLQQWYCNGRWYTEIRVRNSTFEYCRLDSILNYEMYEIGSYDDRVHYNAPLNRS